MSLKLCYTDENLTINAVTGRGGRHENMGAALFWDNLLRITGMRDNRLGWIVYQMSAAFGRDVLESFARHQSQHPERGSQD